MAPANPMFVDGPPSSPIQDFYHDTGVLITGATGFVGKVLIEKLLRSCPGLRTLYLLIRAKKGKSAEARLEELFSDALFQRIIKENPNYMSKIVAVPGDCSLPGLGLSADYRRMIIDNVNVVFHGAATVKFDENLKVAIGINVLGTQEILKCSRMIRNLKAFVYISTAYSNCHQYSIEERCYDPPPGYETIMRLASDLSAEEMSSLTPSLLGKWPNTYTLTKAVAENLVKEEEGILPACIVRPAIVTSTLAEPFEGWMDNFYGPNGIAIGAGCGVLRILQVDLTVEANFVPVDLTVNAIVAAAREASLTFSDGKKEVKVYNYVSATDNPTHFKDFMDMTSKYGVTIPTTKAIWYYSLICIKSRFLTLVLSLLLHFLPALIMDGVSFVLGKKPQMIKLYQRIHRFSSTIAYFSTRRWNFKNDHVKSLWKSLTEEDKRSFNFDICSIEWNSYYRNYIKGARVYVLKDDMTTLPQAQKKWNRLYWCHQALKVITVSLLIKYTWVMMSGLLKWIF